MAKGDGYTFWKDAVEVPWALWCAGGMLLSIAHPAALKAAIYFLCAPFFIFELLFTRRMHIGFFDKVFFSFMMFLRAFARTFGFSTGILHFAAQKTGKKSK